MQIARRVIVSGRVQGVAFRWSAQRQATSLGVTGWVRNLRSGDVEVWIEAEDSTPALAEMLAWLERGPSLARVSSVKIDAVEPEHPATFEVRATESPR